MKVLTNIDLANMLNCSNVDDFIEKNSSQMLFRKVDYCLPTNAAKQLALSNVIEYIFTEFGEVCLSVTGWSVYSDHLELFYKYRSFYNEDRMLIEAPVHIFAKNEREALISILILALYFSWDVSLFDMNGEILIRFDHDGQLAVWAKNKKEFVDACSTLEEVLLPTKRQ